MLVYHGGFKQIKNPDLTHSRDYTDFGRGFYVTENRDMAFKWAARKVGKKCFVNEYNLNIHDLNVVRFKLSENWLDYVSANRQYGSEHNGYNDKNIDVIIGPTADDKLFSSLQMYWKGAWTKEQTMKCLDIVGYSDQIALKTSNALQAIEFQQCIELSKKEQLHWRELADSERSAALKRMEDLIKTEWEDTKMFSGRYDDMELKGDITYDDEPER